MNKKVITATAVLSAGILLLLTIVIGFQTKAKGEDDFRINGTILTAYVGTDTFASVPSTVTSIGEGCFCRKYNPAKYRTSERLYGRLATMPLVDVPH